MAPWLGLGIWGLLTGNVMQPATSFNGLPAQSCFKNVVPGVSRNQAIGEDNIPQILQIDCGKVGGGGLTDAGCWRKDFPSIEMRSTFPSTSPFSLVALDDDVFAWSTTRARRYFLTFFLGDINKAVTVKQWRSLAGCFQGRIYHCSICSIIFPSWGKVLCEWK